MTGRRTDWPRILHGLLDAHYPVDAQGCCARPGCTTQRHTHGPACAPGCNCAGYPRPDGDHHTHIASEEP